MLTIAKGCALEIPRRGVGNPQVKVVDFTGRRDR
jgi:hypothetical protein